MVEGDTKVMLCADRLKVEQVLSNFVSNAVKYSPVANKIIIIVQYTPYKLKVKVTDFGIGIAKENLPFVFDRYFRIEKTSQNYPELGLGLYTASQIVKLHNGDVGVESEFGKGSLFGLRCRWSKVKIICFHAPQCVIENSIIAPCTIIMVFI